MSTISSLGIGSGLELGTLVESLVKAERATAEAPLNRRQLRAESRLSALGSLKGAVGKLADAVTALENFTLGQKATSSAPGVVSATADGEAPVGSYRIIVGQLAEAQSLASNAASPFASLDETLGEGTLTLTVGADSADVVLSAGQNSLADVRDAINASELAVNAVVVDDGNGLRLLLSSGSTGTASQMTLTTTGSVDARLASADMVETVPARDAALTINGLSLSSPTNSIDSALPGVTLELHAATAEGETVTLDVATDRAALRTRLEAVVKAYNALVDNMTASGSATGSGSSGPLVGDASLRSLRSQIGRVFSTGIETGLAGNPFGSTVEIGLHSDVNGKAVLDTDALGSALDFSEQGVEALVAGFSTRFGELLTSFSSEGGIIEARTSQIDAELRRIGRQRGALEERLDTFESRMRAQFTALDSLVAQFQSTSNYLAQQLASLGSLQKPSA